MKVGWLEKYRAANKCIAAFALTLCFSLPAHAESLKEKLAELAPLTLHEGVNELKIGDRSVIIQHGKFAAENAWGADIYSVMVQESGHWQLARMDDGAAAKETNIVAVPHAEEDAISSVAFFLSKQEEGLYLLQTKRSGWKESPYDAVPAKFTLYQLQRDDDFGIYYLRPIASQTTKTRYCNSNTAAYHELGIQPTEGNEVHSCIGGQ